MKETEEASQHWFCLRPAGSSDQGRHPALGSLLSPPLVYCDGSHQNGRSPYWPKACPLGLQSDKSGTEFFFRVVCDGNEESRKIFDDGTLKQKHIFGVKNPNLGSKLSNNVETSYKEKARSVPLGF